MISPGASVTEGQPVMELETDKAVVEVPSSVSGTVKDIRVKQGEKVKVGQVIFTVENGAAAKAGALRPRSESATRRSCTGKARSRSTAASLPRHLPLPLQRFCSGDSGASEFKLPELGENIHQGDLVRLMVSPGSEGFRRAAGDGTGNRQSCGRGSFIVTGMVKDVGEAGREDQGRPGDLHTGSRGTVLRVASAKPVPLSSLRTA